MIRALASLGIASLACVVGYFLLWLLMGFLFLAVDTDGGTLRGGVLTFKIAWSAIALVLTPAGVAAIPATLGRIVGLRGQSLLWPVALALFLYGLMLGLLLGAISWVNDCAVGVAWPISAADCD